MNEQLNRTPRRRKILLWLILFAAAAGGIYYGLEWLIFRWQYVSTDDAQVKGNLINLSAKVPGRIVRLRVEEGDPVRLGQVLVELEEKDYAAARAQAAAALETSRQELAKAVAQLSLTQERITQGIGTAQASLRESGESLKFAEDDAALQADRVHKEIDRARIKLKAAQAKVREAQATADHAQKEFARLQELFRRRYVAENARDAAETAWRVSESQHQVAVENEREARAQLELAGADLKSILLKRQRVRIAEENLEKARLNLHLAREERRQILLQEKSIASLEARVKEAEATHRLADLRLRETAVASPISGVVSKRLGEQGQIVQPGQTILVVNAPGEKWVVANVEETRVRKVHPGAPVRLEADAFPGRAFAGKVEFVASAALSEFALLPVENPSGNYIKITHRLPVRISVEDPEHLLKPGMNVEVHIKAGP
ncbi:MAG: HlyD family secretion protein [Deltaproteobacteria bacterium]|nr:HlyD family secretion protein [Deltaproteobacteria bacterium]